MQEKYEILVRNEKITTINNSSLLQAEQVINKDYLYNPALNYKEDNNYNNTNNRNQYNRYNQDIINKEIISSNISVLTSLQSLNNSKRIQNSKINNDLITTIFSTTKSDKDTTSTTELIPIKVIDSNNNNTLNKRANIFRYIKRKVISLFTKDKTLQNKKVIIESSKQKITLYSTAPANVSYTPKGLMENIVRVVRRRFLNLVSIIIDRQVNHQWANSVTSTSMIANKDIRFAAIHRTTNRDMNKVKEDPEGVR